jgi:hypothetical protein
MSYQNEALYNEWIGLMKDNYGYDMLCLKRNVIFLKFFY